MDLSKGQPEGRTTWLSTPAVQANTPHIFVSCVNAEHPRGYSDFLCLSLYKNPPNSFQSCLSNLIQNLITLLIKNFHWLSIVWKLHTLEWSIRSFLFPPEAISCPHPPLSCRCTKGLFIFWTNHVLPKGACLLWTPSPFFFPRTDFIQPLTCINSSENHHYETSPISLIPMSSSLLFIPQHCLYSLLPLRCISVKCICILCLYSSTQYMLQMLRKRCTKKGTNNLGN